MISTPYKHILKIPKVSFRILENRIANICFAVKPLRAVFFSKTPSYLGYLLDFPAIFRINFVISLKNQMKFSC
jgi:hypothetical protein